MENRLKKFRKSIEQLEVEGYYGNRHDVKDVLKEFDELNQLLLFGVGKPLPSIEKLTIQEFVFFHFNKLVGDQYIRKSDCKILNLETITAEYNRLKNE